MKDFAKALGFFTSGAFLGIATQVVKGKLAALYLGTAGVGLFNQINTAWSLIFTFSSLGFTNGIIRRLASTDCNSDKDLIVRHIYSVIIFLSSISLLVSMLVIVYSSELSNLLLDDGGSHSFIVSVLVVSIPFAVVSRIYQSILNSFKIIKPFIYAQMIADVLSTLIFWVLIVQFNVFGAVISVLIFHTLKLLSFRYVIRKYLNPTYVAFPSYKQFDWSEIQHNIGFGATGLLLVSVGIVTTLIISSWIISFEGLESNGVFSTAWKVSSLYLAALYSSAGGYYYPSLSACTNNREITIKVNEAITLYMYILPVVIAILIVGGSLIIEILFSSDFVYAATLLLLFLPGDYFRVLSETAGLSLLVKRKMLAYSYPYILWALTYLVLSHILLPLYGIIGVAFSYLIAHILQSFLILALVSNYCEFKLNKRAVLSLTRAAMLIGISVCITLVLNNEYIKMLCGLLCISIWLFYSLKDKRFNEVFTMLMNKLGVNYG